MFITIVKLQDCVKAKVEVTVDEKRQIVIAKAVNCTNLGMRAIIRNFKSIYDIALINDSRLAKQLELKRIYVSVAHCHPQDTFDAEIGTAVAIKKITERLNRAITDRKLALAKELVYTACKLQEIS